MYVKRPESSENKFKAASVQELNIDIFEKHSNKFFHHMHACSRDYFSSSSVINLSNKMFPT